MFEYNKIILLTALLSTGSPWVLKSTPTNIVPKLTNDVTLRCHCENSENSEDKMEQLMRIRLLKRNDAGNWITIAEISVPSNSSVSLQHPSLSNIVASGNLGASDESFLSIMWSTADDDTVGSYQCEVDGFGEDSRSDVHLSTQTVNITGFLPTITDLVDIMIKIKHEIQSKIEENFLEVRYWPEGNYSLLSPVSGCPDTPYTEMVRGFVKITTETNHKPNNLLSSPNHLHPDVFERCDNRNVIHLRFCRNSIPEDRAVLWPKGSYCIHHYDWPTCPSGFKAGYIRSYLESSLSMIHKRVNTAAMAIGTFHTDFRFCCRDDGPPNVPVLLPSYKPFYLFRHKGTCQKVRKMDVSEEWIQLDSGSKDNFANPKPDGELNDVLIRMCYYTRHE